MQSLEERRYLQHVNLTFPLITTSGFQFSESQSASHVSVSPAEQ